MFNFMINSSLCFSLVLGMIGMADAATLERFGDSSLKKHVINGYGSNGQDHTIVTEEPTYCDQPIKQIIASKNLETIYDAASYFREMKGFSTARRLYESALVINKDQKQAFVTKMYLAECLINGEDKNWKEAAGYLYEAAQGYDIASAFLESIVPNFRTLQEKDVIERIVAIKNETKTQGPWVIE